MDLSVARVRLSSVVKPDSITASQGDFLATHVPLNRIHILKKFELQPNGGRDYSEEDAYRQFVLNPENKHQFVTVYGQSGTGKSHLIRWFEARYEQDRPENEVVLFIRRSDNTLKGTIRQLLEKPEVQGIANRAVYERLVRAAVFVDAEKLKDMIYHNFIIEIDHDEDESRPIKLNNVKKKRLKAFLSNEVVHNNLMVPSGPIERMYSKIAENTCVDRDTIAQFLPEDFIVSADLYDEITKNGADIKAERMAKELMIDDGGIDSAQKIAGYLNQFVNDVIQRCAGIEPGDFRQIFQDIRCELHKLGKNLTLFIEDVTSFTGVDDALLDALIVEHTGMNAGTDMCRLSSIVGTTSNYLQNNFRDNHKDRITALLYIPSDVFDENGLYEFVGRYINAMSIEENVINEWLCNRALPSDYPVHHTVQGAEWDHVAIPDGKQLPLFPFTKKSILYLYRNSLNIGHQTPRYIIRDVIEPVVREVLDNPEHFPSDRYPMIGVDTTLSYQIHSQIKDQEQADRLLRFLTIWGDGTSNRYVDNNTVYISGIRQSMIEELKLPVINGTAVLPPVPVLSSADDQLLSQPQSKENDRIPEQAQRRFSEASRILTSWVGGATIDVSATGGTVGTLRNAIEDLCSYLSTSIYWSIEGVSPDNVSKALAANKVWITLERQLKNSNGFYMMPANWHSQSTLEAMIRWRVYGKQSWNYPGADFDAYLVTSWSASVRDDIIRAVDEDHSLNTSYVEAAMTAEIYRLILFGIYGEHTLKNLTVNYLFEDKTKSLNGTAHSPEWIKLTEFMTHKRADAINIETIRRYFDLPQGSGGSKLVLNDPLLMKAFHKVKTSKLVVSEEDLQSNDPVKLRRNPYIYLKDILDRVGTVANAELAKAKGIIEKIQSKLDWEDIDDQDILELVSQAKTFYQEVNNAQINIQIFSTGTVKKYAKQIAKAYNDICGVLDEKDALPILMTFSTDPIGMLRPLIELIERLESDIIKVDRVVATRMEPFNVGNSDSETDEQYRDELTRIDRCINSLEGGEKSV